MEPSSDTEVDFPNQCDMIGVHVKDYFSSQDFRSLFQASLNDAITKQMIELRDRLENAEGKILTLEHALREKTTMVDHLQEKQANILQDISKLQSRINDAEQYSRRNCVRIYGIAEKPNENTDALTLELASDMELDIRSEDIDRSHRIGPPHQPTKVTTDGKPPPPRPIIVKFTSYRARNLMILNRKHLKGTKKGIEEDLTFANRLLLSEAKKEVDSGKNKNLIAAWSTDGRIIVLTKTSNGKTMRRRIHSLHDLKNL